MNICLEAGVDDLSDVDMSSLSVNPVSLAGDWRVNLLNSLDGDFCLWPVDGQNVLVDL